MANNQATELLKVLIFTGEPDGRKYDGEKPLSPTDFLRCLKNRKDVYGWDEPKTMQHV